MSSNDENIRKILAKEWMGATSRLIAQKLHRAEKITEEARQEYMEAIPRMKREDAQKKAKCDQVLRKSHRPSRTAVGWCCFHLYVIDE